MRGFGAYAIAVAMALSVLGCANLALASNTTFTIPSTAAIGNAPVGNDLSLIDIGGFLRLLGGFIRIGITAASGAGGGSSGSSLACQGSGNNVGITDTYGTTWHDFCIGAGGFIRGIDIAPDGTTVIRTDTYGAYYWNGSYWQQLVTSTSMPSGFVTANLDTGIAGQGVYEIQIADSNTQIFYMTFDGYVFKTTNRGATWTQTAFTQVGNVNPNDDYAQEGQKMAIDPNNPNIVYVGTEQNGLFVTTSGGTSWSSVSAIPDGTDAGITGMLFDPGAPAGVVGGVTQTIFGGYLKDPTGARRIWPVACHGVIDRDALERDRDQLWAEAVTRYKAGAKWWLETPELEALATAEQALRFKEDAWKDPISKWLGERQDASIAELLEHALKIAPRDQTHSAEIRVATILTQLGFTKYRARKGNQRENRYRRGGEPDER